VERDFPDVEAILMAWHERQVRGHLDQLAAIGTQRADPAYRLSTVLQTYAHSLHHDRGHDVAAALHQGPHMAAARQELHAFVTGLLADAVAAGEVRDDVAPGELAEFCLHALAAAVTLPSNAAVSRLTTVTLAALRAQR
jgi:hypothetical protein